MDLKRIFLKDACPTSIGGQAIMEGIMMRGPKKTAIAIRLPDGSIHMKTQPSPKAGKWGKIPLLRGAISFFVSLVQGTKVLMYSADILEEYYPEDYEKDKFDVWVEKHLGKEKAWSILLFLSVAIALVASVGIFMLLPTAIVGWCKVFTDSVILLNIIEGVVRILIFVGYVWLISKMNDIKTVFRYHGAEHKTIHCFENGLELTPANCRQFPTLHPRCGTSFLMFVFIIAFALHFLLGWPSLWLRILSRLLLLPVIAGLSYELLKWAGRSDNIVVKILSLPGLYLQKITTKQPDDSQLEVAIAAVHAVCDEKPCGTFVICKEDVGHYDGHVLIESSKDDTDAGETASKYGQVFSCKVPAGRKRGQHKAKVRVIFVKRKPLQGRRFI